MSASQARSAANVVEDPYWQSDWRRSAVFDGGRLIMHGKDAFFVCFADAEGVEHRTHLVTEDECEAQRVFEEICEAIHQGMI